MNRNNVKIMRKERRRDRRRDLQLQARLGANEVIVTDVSAAGFGAAIDATENLSYDFRPGQRLRLELDPQTGKSVAFLVEITRPIGSDGVLGGRFVDLSDEGYNIIESILTGRMQRQR
ncbi:MAG: hypothetical protein RH942_12775 [Kiloniellaceae bacterium]